MDEVHMRRGDALGCLNGCVRLRWWTYLAWSTCSPRAVVNRSINSTAVHLLLWQQHRIICPPLYGMMSAARHPTEGASEERARGWTLNLGRREDGSGMGSEGSSRGDTQRRSEGGTLTAA